jgi:4-aminobutyrate aminotransferase
LPAAPSTRAIGRFVDGFFFAPRGDKDCGLCFLGGYVLGGLAAFMAVKRLRAVSGASAEDDHTSIAPDDAWRATLGDATRAMLDADWRVFLGQPAAGVDVIDSARGAYLFERDGREILDFDGAGSGPLGHGHPRAVAAAVEQIETLGFAPPGYANPPSIALAQRLAGLAPDHFDRVLLVSSDARATAAALALARNATGRSRVLAIGAAMQRADALAGGVEHVPPFHWVAALRNGDGDGFGPLADLIESILSRARDFAAVLAEPLDWTTVTPAPAGFWQRVKAACERTGTVLVFDETPSAVGRTGTMFHAEQTGVAPDILVVGKGLGAGVVPVAAVIARDLGAGRPTLAIEQEKNPVGAAVALATLEVIAEDDLIERARGLGHRSLDHLRDIAARFPIFREARGAGLALALELADPRAADRAQRMLFGCLDRGLALRIGGGHTLTLSPPLTIAVPEIERAFQIIEDAAAGC